MNLPFLLLLLPLLASSQSTVQRVVLDSMGNIEYEEDLLPNDECWQYTWVGPYQAADDPEKKTCNDYPPSDICNEPLVFTDGADANHQPYIADVSYVCQHGNNGTGFNCTCKMATGQSCVKYTKFLQDGDDTAVYTSSFCGTGVENSNFGTTTRDSGCFRTAASLGFDIEACFCPDARCNLGLTKSPSLLVLLLAPLLVASQTLTLFNICFHLYPANTL